YAEQGEWHLGQAKCYALMYAREKKLESISIKLTYIHQLDKTQLIKTFDFLTSELEKDIHNIIHEYIVFFKLIYEHSLLRNESAGRLQFPYGNFRPGQRKLAKYSYSIAKNGGILFAEAPTGIGKTISTLFPFVKSFADGENEKIFYLTAKNSGKEMAFDATKLMIEKGLEASAITIMAKEKVCKCPGKACNPDECPFAKGYYSKIKDVIKDSISKYAMFSTDDIQTIADYYAICPFELSLDLSLYVDIIICDYNYFFDPMVYLKRYFDNDASNMLVLVDEAHNLVERGRSMYSASFDTFKYKQVKHSLRHFDHKKIKNAMTRITKLFNNYENLPIGSTKIDMLSKTDLNAIDAYLLAANDVNKNHHSVVTEEFTDFYFDLNKFYRLLDFYDDTFSLYVSKKTDSDWSINLYCTDPSKHLKRTLDQVKGKIIFSATLSPSDYYVTMIGGTNQDPILFLPSPFPKENLRLMVAPKISIKYKNRNETISNVFEYISELINGKVGNYFIYTPSYEYLNQLVPYLSKLDANLIIQEKDMTELEKKQFLSCFVENPTKTTIGLAVVGGAFGEGIDLVGDRIIGVAIIGVGLPQICFERDIIKEYFNKVEEKGFEYAYIAPGLNKVMQAIGRVIRSENDKGVALLIDNRYLTDPYNQIFSGTYNNYKVVMSKEDIKEQVENFWRNK
ncbi:MAG: ATP-dependent DNA helicase, partial [bacterium]|nr:ATP-dependent DNA helicase [bacterium]